MRLAPMKSSALALTAAALVVFGAPQNRDAELERRVAALEQWQAEAQQLLLSQTRLTRLQGALLAGDLDVCLIRNLALIVESQHLNSLGEDPDWKKLYRNWSDLCDAAKAEAEDAASRLR